MFAEDTKPNVIAFRGGGPLEIVPLPAKPFSFDMSQPDSRGMVLIDACIPAEMAIEFFQMMQRYRKVV